MTKEKDRPLIGINMDLLGTGRGQLPQSIVQAGGPDCRVIP